MPTKLELARAYKNANRRHATVCDIHYDHSVMNPNGTCNECIDDNHELELVYRIEKAGK